MALELASPLITEEIFDLRLVGIGCTLNLSNCAITSEKWMCAQEMPGQLGLINIFEKTKKNLTATCEAALIHPKGTLLALRSEGILQIFDLNAQRRIQQTEIRNAKIVHWKWIREDVVAIVTDTTVYHWPIGTESSHPELIFVKHSDLSAAMVINYCADESLQWLVLVAVSVINQRVVGRSQLYSVAQKKSQVLNAESATFLSYRIESQVYVLIAFTLCSQNETKLHITPVEKSATGSTFERKVENINAPVRSEPDFTVGLKADNKRGVLFVIWKSGFVTVHDVGSASTLYSIQIPTTSIIATVLTESGDILALSKSGSLHRVALRDECLISYLESKHKREMAVELAIRFALPGHNNLYIERFNELIEKGFHKEAAELAVRVPNFVLRSPLILNTLRTHSMTAVMTYFGLLLDRDRLVDWEAIQLCESIIQQGRYDLIEKWLRDDRMECSEALGNLLVANNNHTLALSIYLRAGDTRNVINCMAFIGKIDKIFEYAAKMSYKPDYRELIESIIQSQPDIAVNLALMAQEKEQLDIKEAEKIVDLLLRKNLIEGCITFLKQCAKINVPEVGPLQTKLLRMYLENAPHYADAILASRTLSFFNEQEIAIICEQRGLLHRALDLYKDSKDWKRILNRASEVPFLHLLNFFERLEVELITECLSAMFSAGHRSLAVEIVTRCHQRMEMPAVIELFEKFEEPHGLFSVLSRVVLENEDEEIHFKYVETAAKIGRFYDLELFCKQSPSIDPIRVKNFLLGEEKNYGPFMALCNRFNMVRDLVLFAKNTAATENVLCEFVKGNPFRLPDLVDNCLSLDVSDSTVANIISLADDNFANDIIDVAEKYGRISILSTWLLELINKGSENIRVHTVLAQVKILSNNQAGKFLEENKFYDARVVGKFCEKHNPELAILAYSRGDSDDELIRFCEETGLMKPLARYLLKSTDSQLWDTALKDNIKMSLAEIIINLVTVEPPNHDIISVIVVAFMKAELNLQLIRLIESLIFDCVQLKHQSNLQDMLILLAMKHEPAKVKGLIETLQDYSGKDIGDIAQKSGLFSEAVFLYERCGAYDNAINVILNDLKDLEYAQACAEKFNKPSVWVQLGKALLMADDAKLGIDALVRAGDASCYQEVIQAAVANELWEKLINYLKSARKNAKESAIDEELLFTFAKVDRLADLKTMISQPHYADLKVVAERCYKGGFYNAAKVLYEHLGCFAQVAEVLAEIGDLQGAICSARKAANLKTWWKLCSLSFDKDDLDSIITTAQHLFASLHRSKDLVYLFEAHGRQMDAIGLLENMAKLEPNNILLTELIILLIRHQPEKVHNNLQTWSGRFHVPCVLKALTENHLWADLATLLEDHGDSLEAVNVMILHPTEAWEHDRFKELLKKVMNRQLITPVISFYLEYKPLLLIDLLITLGPRMDARRVISSLVEAGHIKMSELYLTSRLGDDNRAVNVTLCELLIQEDNWMGLRDMLTTQNNLDFLELANRLERHEVIGFRIVAVLLYRKTRKWLDALRVCKENGFHREAIQVVVDSEDKNLAEDLLKLFMELERKDCFTATLFHCCHLIAPDVVLEYALRYDVWRFAMPYLIQFVHDLGISSNVSSEK